MKEYILSLKTGEAISIAKAPSLEEAIIYFSGVKRLTQESLLDIYNVNPKPFTINLADYCKAHKNSLA
jgi:hypothetical protein